MDSATLRALLKTCTDVEARLALGQDTADNDLARDLVVGVRKLVEENLARRAPSDERLARAEQLLAETLPTCTTGLDCRAVATWRGRYRYACDEHRDREWAKKPGLYEIKTASTTRAWLAGLALLLALLGCRTDSEWQRHDDNMNRERVERCRATCEGAGLRLGAWKVTYSSEAECICLPAEGDRR